jgi:hypothetical protein
VARKERVHAGVLGLPSGRQGCRQLSLGVIQRKTKP